MFYDASVTASLSDIPWGAKYVSDNDVIRYVSIESRKHNSGSTDRCDALHSPPLSILVHTSVPFGLENEKQSAQEIEEIILRNLALVIPTLGQTVPVHRELVYWKESQVSKGLSWRNKEGSAFFPTASKSKGVVIAGDYFTESNFEGCLSSAYSAASSIHRALI